MANVIIKVLNRLGLLERVNLVGTSTINGRTVRVPVLKKMGFKNLYLSEPWMTDILSKLKDKFENSLVIDVGVNLGQTLIKLKSVSPDIQYLGFEPNPVCNFYTKELIKENNYQNCRIVPVGISDNTDLGVLNFFYKSEVDSSASIIENFRPDQKVVRQEFIPLFQYSSLTAIFENSKVALIKIDVEGAELEVLTGFREILKTDRPLVLCEVLPAYKAENEERVSRQNAIASLLQENNYKIFRILKSESNRFKGLEQLEDFGIHGDIDMCDYVFAPNENSDLIKL